MVVPGRQGRSKDSGLDWYLSRQARHTSFSKQRQAHDGRSSYGTEVFAAGKGAVRVGSLPQAYFRPDLQRVAPQGLSASAKLRARKDPYSQQLTARVDSPHRVTMVYCVVLPAPVLF